MTKEQAKEMLPIFKAFAEGKTIQILNEGEWCDLYDTDFKSSINKYRIKPEPKYRPFKTEEECWDEMLKHQPFGWLKTKTDGRHRFIGELYSLKELFTEVLTVTPMHVSVPYSSTVFDAYTFADGTPFGIKEE